MNVVAHDIHSAGQHLLKLIDDILDLSKAEAGKLDLHEEIISLPEHFQDCIRLMKCRAGEKNIALNVFVQPELPRLSADRLRLKQILLNLLSNAVKFTMSGGKVTVSAKKAHDGGIVLCVEDNGIGMAPDAIPLALEPFRQIDSPLCRNSEGTGLGLSLVKTMVELHGGRLSICSAENEGTAVKICFPSHRNVAREFPDAANAG